MEKKFDIELDIGNRMINIYGVSSVERPKNNSVIFVTEKYAHMMENLTNIRSCLIFLDKQIEIPHQMECDNCIVSCDRPRLEMARFFRENGITSLPQKEEGKWENGYFKAHNSIIGEGSIIMEGAYIGNEVVVGRNVYIGCGVKLLGKVIIGNNTVIRENTVIGCEGLSYERDENGELFSIPQFGGVIIGDNVVIGALTVVAKGAIDNTIIESGVKIDNACFISHNVRIGENTTIVGETLLMGSVEIGKYSNISGNVTVRDKVKVGEKSFSGMGSVIVKDIEDGKIVVGNPARTFRRN